MFQITKKVKLIEKKEFIIVAFNPEYKTFVVHIATLDINLENNMHLLKKTQIAHLEINKALTKVISKYIIL